MILDRKLSLLVSVGVVFFVWLSVVVNFGYDKYIHCVATYVHACIDSYFNHDRKCLLNLVSAALFYFCVTTYYINICVLATTEFDFTMGL